MDILRSYARAGVVSGKLERLIARGHVERAPSPVQLAVGAYDMLRFWISPAAADCYESKQISYTFHQVLRFLDEPASLLDPVGFFSTRDGIIGHLMQVVHANPLYDFQLLDIDPHGLDELALQLHQMLDGTHPRAKSIGAIVEEPEYHQRLLDFLIAWRRDPQIAPMLRSNVAEKPELALLEKTFGSLTAAMMYFCMMPETSAGAINYLRKTSTFTELLGLAVTEQFARFRERTPLSLG